MKYYGYFEVRDDNGELIDDYKEWCEANSESEAWSEFESRCGRRSKVVTVYKA